MIFDADAAVAEATGKPFVSFRLGGTEFFVRNPLPAWPGLRLARDQMSTVASWAQFLREIVQPDQADDVDPAIERSGVSAEVLLEIAKHCVEESTQRPTRPRSGTSGTRQPRGPRSKPASSSKASTSRKHLSVAS